MPRLNQKQYPEAQRKYSRSEKGKRNTKSKKLKQRYGINLNDYEAMLRRQRNKCLICRKPERRIIAGKLIQLSVDHCHRTGVVRGLLCSSCNVAIGMFEESVKTMKRAIDYVKGD